MSSWQRYSICLFALGIIAFSIMLRAEPQLFSQQILQQFSITPSMFNNLLANYQYSLMVTLIFAGCFVDYFGPRRIILISSLVALAGNILFTFSHSLNLLLYGRIIIGYAHPFILIGILKLGLELLSARHFAFFTGLVFSISLLTPELAKHFITSNYSFFNVLILINIMGAILIVSYFGLYSPRYEMNRNEITFREVISTGRNYKIWLIALISVAGWLTNTFFLNWGVIFLIHIYNVAPRDAIAIVSASFIAFAISAVIMGALADFLNKKRLLVVASYIVGGLCFTLILLSFDFSVSWTTCLFYLTAIGCSAVILCYALALNYCSIKNAGFTFGLIACLTTLGNTFYALYLSSNLKPLLTHPEINSLSAWLPCLIIIPSSLFFGSIIAAAFRSPRHQPA